MSMLFTPCLLYTSKQGLFSILVLTGETKPEDLAASDIKPDLVLDRLAALVPSLS